MLARSVHHVPSAGPICASAHRPPVTAARSPRLDSCRVIFGVTPSPRGPLFGRVGRRGHEGVEKDVGATGPCPDGGEANRLLPRPKPPSLLGGEKKQRGDEGRQSDHPAAQRHLSSSFAQLGRVRRGSCPPQQGPRSPRFALVAGGQSPSLTGLRRIHWTDSCRGGEGGPSSALLLRGLGLITTGRVYPRPWKRRDPSALCRYAQEG